MKSIGWLMLVAGIALIAAGCTAKTGNVSTVSVQSNVPDSTMSDIKPESSQPEQPEQGFSEKAEQPSASSSVGKDGNQTVETDHLRILVNKDWGVQKGLESVSFTINGRAVGGIDGLGFAEDVNRLIPNHSEVIRQTELKGLAVKAIEVRTKTESLGGEEAEELHIFFFLNDQQVVYDLHFQADSIDEQTALNIAKTAVKRN